MLLKKKSLLKKYEEKYGKNLVRKAFNKYKQLDNEHFLTTLVSTSITLAPSLATAIALVERDSPSNSDVMVGVAFAILGSKIALDISQEFENILFPKEKIGRWALLNRLFGRKSNSRYFFEQLAGFTGIWSGFLFILTQPMLGSLLALTSTTMFLYSIKARIYDKGLADLNEDKAFEMLKDNLL